VGNGLKVVWLNRFLPGLVMSEYSSFTDKKADKLVVIKLLQALF